MGGLIEFQTGPIADIGSQTMNQKAVWDGIWESTKARISATAAEALDAGHRRQPGGARRRSTTASPRCTARTCSSRARP